MARRSNHAPEILREMILEAAEELIRKGGLASLSAREIARLIGYSPGTLYNVYANLDDIVLHVEGRTLDAMLMALQAVPKDGDATQRLERLVSAYLGFTTANPKLWNLLFEHRLPDGLATPPWYREKIEKLMSELRQALRPLATANGGGDDKLEKATTVLWASVHGIASLATAGKLTNVTSASAHDLARDLVTRYIVGLRQPA